MNGRTVLSMAGDTVDEICWREYGRTAGTVEAVLNANPGLAAVGLLLPAGITIHLPEFAPATVAETTRLWD